MANPFLKPVELSCGPDLLRPGSKTAHLGNGEITFIYAKYSDPDGRRFFTAPAVTGHEFLITEENILQALFGPDLDGIRSEISFTQAEYDNDGVPTGRKKPCCDHHEIRRRSRDSNLYGRYGAVRGRHVLMLWQYNEGWREMLVQVIEQLQVPDDAILTVGTSEVGTIQDFKSLRAMKTAASLALEINVLKWPVK